MLYTPIEWSHRALLIWLMLFCSVMCGSGGAQEPSYPSITGPCRLSFPGDHGPHPHYKTEWWYYTGNLRSATGREFGFQLTFFRSRMNPPGFSTEAVDAPSPWRTDQIYLAHAALSDIAAGKHYTDEGVVRGALNMADARLEPGGVHIFFKDWHARIESDRHILHARSREFGFDLVLTPSKPPIPHGIDGYSLKGRSPESASCYYSFTRLAAHGLVTVNGQIFEVTGQAWMDHEYSSAPLDTDLQGWDWFSLQFDDGSELMVYLMRRKDGAFSEASSGTYVTEDGRVVPLSSDAIGVQVLGRWKSTRTGTTYPADWRITIAPLGLDARIRPKMSEQEMVTEGSTQITYWEGSISVEGKGTGGKKKSGEGYVELTGYHEAMAGRL